MRALVFTRPGAVELLDVAEPQPADGEVLVRVAAVGICGSELHGIRSSNFRTPPLIMGHEFAGTLPDGGRVVVNPLLSCGTCDMCVAGRDHLCRHRSILGIHRAGAFAEWVAVPQRALHPLPPQISFETAALIEPLANAVHALNIGAPPADCRVAIIGAGTIGLVSLLVARQYTDRIVVCDTAADRLAFALRLGAAEVTDRLSGEFDLVVDAVGAPATHRDSVDRLRPGGTAVWVGLLSSDPGFDGQILVREEKRVLGSYCYTDREFGRAVELAEVVPLDWGSPFGLEDGQRIFRELMDGRHDIIKAVLRP
jgi:alcohol dehydrogenase